MEQLHRLLALLGRVTEQTERRVLHGEVVPAPEKVVSLVEPHADVILKDRRATYYGHKIFLTGGTSGLITDCAIVKGNPAYSTWATPMLRRQCARYGRVPRQASFDGGFASRENLREAKALGVTNVRFAKRRGLAGLNMVKSSWVYRKLKRFRAGIERVISFLSTIAAPRAYSGSPTSIGWQSSWASTAWRFGRPSTRASPERSRSGVHSGGAGAHTTPTVALQVGPHPQARFAESHSPHQMLSSAISNQHCSAGGPAR